MAAIDPKTVHKRARRVRGEYLGSWMISVPLRASSDRATVTIVACLPINRSATGAPIQTVSPVQTKVCVNIVAPANDRLPTLFSNACHPYAVANPMAARLEYAAADAKQKTPEELSLRASVDAATMTPAEAHVTPNPPIERCAARLTRQPARKPTPKAASEAATNTPT